MPSLPEISNTYQFRVNIACAEADDTTHRQRVLFEIVRSILALGTGWTNENGTSITPSSPWDVYSSSDSTGVASVNRWEALADLVWAAEGVAHSWIVLVHDEFFGVGEPLYMLINCTPGGTRNATLGVHLSRNPFDEGGITDRPTATDEVEVLPTGGNMTTSPWQGSDGSTEDDRTGRLHCWLSEDGRIFRCVVSRLGEDVAFWDLFRDANHELTDWTIPAAMAVVSHDSAAAVLTGTIFAGSGWYWSRDDVSLGDVFQLQPSMTYVALDPVTDLAVNTGTGFHGWDTIKLGALLPAAGLRCAIPDAWWGLDSTPNGAFGDDLTFQQFQHIVLPWNGSVVQKT